MLNLLSLTEDQVLSITTIVSITVIVLLIGAILLLGRKNFKPTAKMLAFISVSVALTTVLSLIKFEMPFLNGGSITLFSLVPVLLVAYKFDFTYGLITGLITGLLQFLTSPWILTPLTFFLDYVLAFSTVSFACIFKKAIKNKPLSIGLGTVTAYFVRFLMHFLSGLIYFASGYITEGFPADNMFIYSLCYNVCYVLPDMVIALVFILPFAKTKTFERYFLTGDELK